MNLEVFDYLRVILFKSCRMIPARLMLRQYPVECNYFDTKFSNILWGFFAEFLFRSLNISQHVFGLTEENPQGVVCSQPTTLV